MKKVYEIIVSYPDDVLEVEANNEHDAEERAWEILGEQSFNCQKECTLQITEQ